MEYFDRHKGGERAILVHLDIHQIQDPDDLEEFELLASSAGAEKLTLITGKKSKPDAKYFVGSGKAEEIASAVEELDADIVIFNHGLSPSQERNLESLCKCRVLDRTGLILDIFAQRARTYEGKLQVELAQLNHLSTRLVRGWTHLERQKGGIGLRGPGETQLETDRRLLQKRVSQLQHRIEKVKKTRAQGRAKRQKSETLTVSLVGYTNAGKSTLFNQLVNEEIYAADKLFATLDPTLRQLVWKGVGKIVLVDTVGFVKHLPHELVESFHATLEETLEADLLLHIIDSANPKMQAQIDAVNEVLAQIKNDVPILEVYNKIDKTEQPPLIGYENDDLPDKVYLSARTAVGIDELTVAVQQLLTGKLHTFQLSLPYNADFNRGQFQNSLYEINVIEGLTYDDNGKEVLNLRLTIDKLRQLLGQAGINPIDVLPLEQATLLEKELEEFEVELKRSKNDSLETMNTLDTINSLDE